MVLVGGGVQNFSTCIIDILKIIVIECFEYYERERKRERVEVLSPFLYPSLLFDNSVMLFLITYVYLMHVC